jgi:hypothetical protein
MERLVLRRDYPRLPQVAPADVAGLVEGYQVSNERTSAVRYLADLTVTFKPTAVRNVMAQAGIPIAETPSGLTLVLPVWRGPQGVQLFEDTNPWREAWIRIATGKGLVPLIMPLGDTGDLALINAEQAASGNANALAAIAQHYNVGQVIVAVASGDAKGETIDQLVVTMYVTGGQRSLVNVTPRRPPEALLATALAISQEVEETWKVNVVGGPGAGPTVSSGGDTAPVAGADATGPGLPVMVPVRQLSEWLAIRKKLGDVALIKKIDVSSLGVDGAQIVLGYVGGEQQLVAALAQVDLVLSNEGSGWVLRARGGSAGPGPARATPTAPPPSGAPPPGAATPATPPAPTAPATAAPPASSVPPVTAVPTTIGPAPGASPGNAPATIR